MKKILLSSLAIFAIISVSFGQNNTPVAVNDTIKGFVGQTYTLNMLKNDFDPDGDSIYLLNKDSRLIRINDTTWELTMTESNIGNPYYPVQELNYMIKDENGLHAEGNVVFIPLYPPTCEKIDMNNISAVISPFGAHFYDGQTAGLEVPKGSGKIAVFGQELFIGGLDMNGQVHFSGKERVYSSQKDFYQGPISTIVDTSYVKVWNRVWKISKEEILYHINNWKSAGYAPIDAIASWPAHGDVTLGQTGNIAPFFDNNANGRYEPMAGDYPLIRGDQAVYFIMNDSTGQFFADTVAAKMGLEIHGMAYEFDRPDDSVLNNTLFFHLDILNRSLADYDSTYIGLFNDFDLGNSTDDFVGTDVNHGMVYAYNKTSVDGNGEGWAYGEHPPAVGMRLIGGPYMDNDGADNPNNQCDYSINGLNFGDDVIDNERYGVTNSMSLDYLINGKNILSMSDPVRDYHYMQNIYSDGTHMIFGGGGHVSTGGVGPECRFVYPGSSDTLCNWGTNNVMPNGGYNQNGYFWTEILADSNDFDREILSAAGPFTFKSGDVQPLDYCFTFARDYDGDNLSSLQLLLDNNASLTSSIAELIELPENILSTKGVAKVGKMYATPNPAKDRIRINFEGKSGQGYQLYDCSGKQVKTGTLNSGENEINIQDLKPGLYVLRSVNVWVKIIKI